LGLGISASTDDRRAPVLDLDDDHRLGAYMLFRMIAKAATRSRAHDPREDLGPGRD
jgi:hypothetical protein